MEAIGIHMTGYSSCVGWNTQLYR